MRSKIQGQHAQWCVFTSAGDYHNVMAWSQKAQNKKWDLITAFYGDQEAVFDQLRNVSTIAFKSKGSKFQNLKKFYTDQPNIFADYDFIFVVDDDIHIDADQIHRLFEIAEAYDFWVCQPAFSPEGRISHAITAKAGTQIRITNFVELTCPLFRRDKLIEFLQVYDRSLAGWGIDWWYCIHFGANKNRKFAVIDEVTVINPHPQQRRGKAREIEKLQSDATRESHWRETARNLHLIEYEHLNLAYIKDANDLRRRKGAFSRIRYAFRKRPRKSSVC